MPAAPTDPSPDPPDREQPSQDTVSLLRRCREGEPDALDRLVQRFYGPVRRMVRARLGRSLRRREDLEDVVQETFLRVLRSWSSFEPLPDGRFANFLATLVQREIASRAHFHAAQKRDLDREVPLERMRAAGDSSRIELEIVADTTSVPSKVSRAELAEIVDGCLLDLDEDQREVILLRDYSGADWEYIAGKLERPSVAAAQQMHRRARVKLCELVQHRL